MKPSPETVFIADVIIGMIVTIFGIVMIKNTIHKRCKNYTGFLLIPTGISLTIVGLLIKFGSEKVSEKAFNGTVIYIVVAFAIAGLSMILNSIATLNYRKKYCTYTVAAICVDIKRRVTSDTETRTTVYYTPVLEFDHEGTKKTIQTKRYTSQNDCPPIGGMEIIHVDPENAENYYTDSPSEGLIREMIWGAVLAIPSLAITIAALFSFIK